MRDRYNPLCLAPYVIPMEENQTIDEKTIIQEAMQCPFREEGKEESFCSEMRRKGPTMYNNVCPVLKRHPKLIEIVSKHTPER